MDVYAVFDENKNAVAFYDMAAYNYELPDDCVKISREDHVRLSQEPAYWRWNGTTTVPVAPQPPVAVLPDFPESISTRQFFQYLAKQGECTEDEALAYVANSTLPKILATVINTLPASIQFDVRIEVMGAKTFDRSSQSVTLLAWLLGKDDEALNQIWRGASKL